MHGVEKNDSMVLSRFRCRVHEGQDGFGALVGALVPFSLATCNRAGLQSVNSLHGA